MKLLLSLDKLTLRLCIADYNGPLSISSTLITSKNLKFGCFIFLCLIYSSTRCNIILGNIAVK